MADIARRCWLRLAAGRSAPTGGLACAKRRALLSRGTEETTFAASAAGMGAPWCAGQTAGRTATRA